VASAIGAPYTVLLSGIMCLLGGALFANQLPALKEKIRPVYARLGITPLITSGIEAASELTGNPEE